MPTTALLIIDMQHAMQTYARSPRNNPDAEQHIATLLAAWRGAGQPVIHIRHISRCNASVFSPGQSGAAFQPQFMPQTEEHVVEKNVPDAFIQSGLEHWLHVRGIRHLVIVGVATNNSVESTARSAGNLGFNTLVVSDATFTFAQRDYAGTERSADDVHLMSLANMHCEYATVCSTAEALSSLAA